MAYKDGKIKVDSSLKELNNKVITDIENKDEKIYWYIKFNQSLDEASVSNKTMQVTQSNGYLFNTKIIYNKHLELIVIEPLEKYKEGEYYILHVKKEVRSKNMKSLKNDVHILFKVHKGVVSEFKELPSYVKVPKPRKKPLSKRIKTKSKVYLFQKHSNKKLNLDSSSVLQYLPIKINPLVGIAGIALAIGGFLSKVSLLIIPGLITSFLGIIHLFKQINSFEFKSNFNYNLGVARFNKEKYKKAEISFKKALSFNTFNEHAEYALSKVSFYL